MPAIQYINDTFKGIDRKENKDRVWVSEPDYWLLAVLFDGISSAKQANRGIDVAVDFLEKNYKKYFSNEDFALADLMFQVNKKIVETGLESPFTTYCAVYLNFNSQTAKYSNLGDSRVYEVSPQYLKQLTKDDNPAYDKNIVTKFLGTPDLRREQIREVSTSIQGKHFLLCSDGFYSIMEKKLSRFFKVLNFSSGLRIKKALCSEIQKQNFDDASYTLILSA